MPNTLEKSYNYQDYRAESDSDKSYVTRRNALCREHIFKNIAEAEEFNNSLPEDTFKLVRFDSESNEMHIQVCPVSVVEVILKSEMKSQLFKPSWESTWGVGVRGKGLTKRRKAFGR